MKNKNFIVLALVLTLALSANLALAENTASTTARTAKIEKLVVRANQEITNRITAINKLIAKIQGMKLVSDVNKMSLVANLQKQITDLNALKDKLATEMDMTALKDGVKSITHSYRIYALVVPQGHILAMADRLNTIAGDLTAVVAKFQLRLADAQTAGKDITDLNATLDDLKAKIADAQNLAQKAVSGIAGLAPDNGDTAVLQSNKMALAQARKDLQAGHQALVTAHKNTKEIKKGLEAFK